MHARTGVKYGVLPPYKNCISMVSKIYILLKLNAKIWLRSNVLYFFQLVGTGLILYSLSGCEIIDFCEEFHPWQNTSAESRRRNQYHSAIISAYSWTIIRNFEDSNKKVYAASLKTHISLKSSRLFQCWQRFCCSAYPVPFIFMMRLLHGWLLLYIPLYLIANSNECKTFP